MTAPWRLICIVLAFVLAAIGAFAWPAPVEPFRLKLLCAAFMFFMLAQMISG